VVKVLDYDETYQCPRCGHQWVEEAREEYEDSDL
jgi:hypothetical protein